MAAESPGSEETNPRLREWLDQLFGRLEPARLRFQAGETLGQVVARILDEEEHALRAGQEEPGLLGLKLRALAELRRNFGLSGAATPEASSPPKEESMSPDSENRPTEATYEMVMGGLEDLKEVPLAHFMQLVQLWQQVVAGLGQAGRVPETFLQEYIRVTVTLSPEDKNPEFVAWFRGSRDMIHFFRDKLRELGLESS